MPIEVFGHLIWLEPNGFVKIWVLMKFYEAIASFKGL
jgi:hypothetical protein